MRDFTQVIHPLPDEVDLAACPPAACPCLAAVCDEVQGASCRVVLESRPWLVEVRSRSADRVRAEPLALLIPAMSAAISIAAFLFGASSPRSAPGLHELPARSLQ